MLKTRYLTLFAVVLLMAGSLASAAEAERILPVNNTPVPCTDCRTPVTAPVLLDQPPNQGNGIFADLGCDICGSGIQILADNYNSDGTTVDTVIVWGGCYPGNVCPDPHDFDITFEGDVGAPDGSPQCAYTGLAPTCEDTGVVLFGVSEFKCTFTGLACSPAGGATWVLVNNDTGYGTDDWFWELGDFDATNGIAGSAWATSAPPPATWNLDGGNDLSIQILGPDTGDGGDGGDGGDDGGDVPATTTIGLVLMVLALGGGSAYFLRRK
jgi:hypothetical protein